MEHFICDEEGLKRFVNVPFALNRQQLEKNKQNADSAPPGKISADAHSYCAHQCIVEYFVFHIHNTWTHIGRNFDLIRYFKRAWLSTSSMWHGGLNLVQPYKMWCAVCTLPHSHKSEPHRPIISCWPEIGRIGLKSANTSHHQRLSWAQAFLVMSQHVQYWQGASKIPGNQGSKDAIAEKSITGCRNEP